MPRRDDQKTWIRRQAAVLWAEKGFAATSVEQLCDATDLGRGALYYHIGNKEQLLYEITIASGQRLIPRAETIVAGDAPAAEKLRQLSRELLRAIADDQPEWEVSQRERGTLTGARADAVQEQRDHYEALWSDVVDGGVAAGEFQHRGPLIVKGVLGLFVYSYTWMRPDGAKDPEQIADMFCDMLLTGLRGAPDRYPAVQPPSTAMT